MTGWRLAVAKWALQSHLRGAEKVLPVVLAALPADRRYRAEWGFGQLKEALEGPKDG